MVNAIPAKLSQHQMALAPGIQHPNEHTRTRLLNRLGLFQCPPSTDRRSYPNSSSLHSHRADLRTIHPSLVRNGSKSAEAMLTRTSKLEERSTSSSPTECKNNDDSSRSHQDNTSSFSSSHNSSNDDNLDRRVQFNETVNVLSIPSRHQFSNRIKKVYWSSKEEICENVERNVLEFTYEDWDYNNVVLEDEMYIDTATGELVHPVHLRVDEAKCQPVYNSKQKNDYSGVGDDAEQSKSIPEPDDEEEDDGYEYEYDDSYFRPLQRQSSVASSQ
jgi:hypothetical protein